MKWIPVLSFLFSSYSFAADLLPEAVWVSSALSAVAQTCNGTSDCKSDLVAITKKLESQGFTILKTSECSTKYIASYSCPNEQKPIEQGTVYFVR
ncbi:MAG: hypothetical protein V4654_05955 [Bdellovibrionota bacterium]